MWQCTLQLWTGCPAVATATYCLEPLISSLTNSSSTMVCSQSDMADTHTHTHTHTLTLSLTHTLSLTRSFSPGPDLYDLACRCTVRRDNKGTLVILRCLATLVPRATNFQLGAVLVRTMAAQGRSKPCPPLIGPGPTPCLTPSSGRADGDGV